MFELEVDRVISAAHQLHGYGGACCNLHGHNYRVTVVLRARELDEIGIAFDFKKLKATLNTFLDAYDHKCLNELPDFMEINPTSENIARMLFKKLSVQLNDGNVRVRLVRVSESDSSRAAYLEDDNDDGGSACI